MKNLFILAFDHRSSFIRDLVGKNDRKKISKLKNIIFEGFLLAYKKIKNSGMGILVDENYGSSVIKKAKKEKIVLCLPVEKSGREILEFEYDDKFGEHIKKIKPDFVKVLVRYKKSNKKQLENLRKLSDFCLKNKYKLILELLVPVPEKQRLAKTLAAIKEIKNNLQINIWKLEGFDKAGWQRVIKEVNANSKIIVLGRAEEAEKVRSWLKSAKSYKKIIGFAIGRTIFMEPLKKLLAAKMTKKQATLMIAQNYLEFIKYWLE